MNIHIENVVIGKPICSEEEIFGINVFDWESVEKEKTIWVSERFLPKIMAGDIEADYFENSELKHGIINLGLAPSSSEIRRNRKDLVISLDNPDYIEIKYGKKRLFVLVGKQEENG
jgi:hypothetical protein